MKQVIFLFAFLFSIVGFAQDSTKTIVKAPKIVTNLHYGKALEVDNLEFKLVAIESDSRCPKGVQCIWAGEAVVLIDVFKNGKKLEQKRVVFSPSSPLEKRFGNMFSSEKFNVTGINIAPYPEYRKKIKLEDYYIQLEVND